MISVLECGAVAKTFNISISSNSIGITVIMCARTLRTPRFKIACNERNHFFFSDPSLFIHRTIDPIHMRPYIIYMKKRDPNSNERYHCIVFHCDFSAGCMKGDTQKNRTVSTSASVLSKHQYSCSSCTTAWYGTRIHRQVSAIHSLTQQMRMKRDQNSIQIDSHTDTTYTFFISKKRRRTNKI